MSCAQQVHIQPRCPRNSRRQLPEKCIASVDVDSFAIPRLQQSTFLRAFSRIMGPQKRLEMSVPLIHEVETAFLYPAIEIVLSNLVGKMKHSRVGRQHLHRGL